MHADCRTIAVVSLGLSLLLASAGIGSPAGLPAAPPIVSSLAQRIELQEPADHLRASDRFREDGVVRTGKLVTLHSDLIRRSLGSLPAAEQAAVDDLLRQALAL